MSSKIKIKEQDMQIYKFSLASSMIKSNPREFIIKYEDIIQKEFLFRNDAP